MVSSNFSIFWLTLTVSLIYLNMSRSQHLGTFFAVEPKSASNSCLKNLVGVSEISLAFESRS